MPHAQPSPPSKSLAQPLTSRATDAGAASPGQSQFPLTLMQARLSRGWTQLQLADLIGTTSQTVSRWERGAATPGLYHRHKLCVLFGLSLAELGWSVEAGTENEASITDGNEAGQAPEGSNTGISSDTGQLLADEAGPLASQSPLPPSAPAGLSETGKHVSEQARVTVSPIRPVQYRRRRRHWRLFASSCLGIVLASTFGLIALNWFWPAALSSPTNPKKSSSLPLPSVGAIVFLSSGDVAGNSAQGMNDEIAMHLADVPAPPPGTSYVAWMTGSSGSEAVWTPLGQLAWTPTSAPVSGSTLHAGKDPETGTASLFSASPQHTNLLVTFNRFLITIEATRIPPQQPSSTWVYAANISAIPTPGDPNHYSLLDHLRHLLAADPSLAALGIRGGLVYWLTRNTQQVALEASHLETDWHTHRVSSLRQRLICMLEYLDGNTGVQADLPADTPRFLPLPFARVGLLTLSAAQEPPGYALHTAVHLQGVAQALGASASQRQLAGQLRIAMNAVGFWLSNVRQDALQLVRMNDASLARPSTLPLLSDLAAQAQDAYAGSPLGQSGQAIAVLVPSPSATTPTETLAGVRWIAAESQHLATFSWYAA